MMYRQLLAAGIVRDIEFFNKEVLDIYLYSLDHRQIEYKVLDTFCCDDGSIIFRIVQQYNNADLIKL